MRKAWTEEEVQFLRDSLGDKSQEEIAKHLGRPETAVGNKMRREGLVWRNNGTTRFIEAFGESKSVREWSNDKRCEVSYTTLQCRIAAGWDFEEAILTRNRAELMKVGEKINRLTLRRIFKKELYGCNETWGEFDCECGGNASCKIAQVMAQHNKSCGCLTIDLLVKRSTTHGLSRTNLYSRWCGIKDRCYSIKDAKYLSYGGRGIRMCDEWLNDFQTFYDWSLANGYSEELSIDRKDENLGYSPENCRWTDQAGQNESRHNNRMIVAWGEMNSLIRWCQDPRCNADIGTIKERLSEGWSTEDAISKC